MTTDARNALAKQFIRESTLEDDVESVTFFMADGSQKIFDSPTVFKHKHIGLMIRAQKRPEHVPAQPTTHSINLCVTKQLEGSFVEAITGKRIQFYTSCCGSGMILYSILDV